MGRAATRWVVTDCALFAAIQRYHALRRLHDLQRRVRPLSEFKARAASRRRVFPLSSRSSITVSAADRSSRCRQTTTSKYLKILLRQPRLSRETIEYLNACRAEHVMSARYPFDLGDGWPLRKSKRCNAPGGARSDDARQRAKALKIPVGA